MMGISKLDHLTISAIHISQGLLMWKSVDSKDYTLIVLVIQEKTSFSQWLIKMVQLSENENWSLTDDCHLIDYYIYLVVRLVT